MSTHWKKLTNPNYIGSYALEPGKDLIVEIKSVAPQMIKGNDGSSEEKVVAELVNQKPMVLNSTNMGLITDALKTPYIEEWVGKKIALYVTKVSAFGETVDALRVRPYAPATSTAKAVKTTTEAVATQPDPTDAFDSVEIRVSGEGSSRPGAKYRFDKVNKKFISWVEETK